MTEIRNECGKLLERMERLWLMRSGTDSFDRKLMRCIIRDYRHTLKYLERYKRPAKGQEDGYGLYLSIRKNRLAASRRMIRTVPKETLYRFLVQNICDLEAMREGG